MKEGRMEGRWKEGSKGGREREKETNKKYGHSNVSQNFKSY